VELSERSNSKLKFKIGQLVRFTEFETFGNSDLFGYVTNYYGSNVGLRHYMIRDYNGDITAIYMRTAKHMKPVTKEEEFLLFLVNK